MDTLNWYLACHKTGKQNALKAQMFLSQIGVTTFIPQMCYHEPRTDRPEAFKKKIEPLFPGYLFLCFDYNEVHTSKIERCPGMSYLVRFGDVIQPIHDSTVDMIMKLTLSVCYDSHKRPFHNDKHAETVSVECCEEERLTKIQSDKIKALIEERDGLARSAILYDWIAPSINNSHFRC